MSYLSDLQNEPLKGKQSGRGPKKGFRPNKSLKATQGRLYDQSRSTRGNPLTRFPARRPVQPSYSRSVTLVERLHRRFLDVIKDEFDRRGRATLQFGAGASAL